MHGGPGGRLATMRIWDGAPLPLCRAHAGMLTREPPLAPAAVAGGPVALGDSRPMARLPSNQ